MVMGPASVLVRGRCSVLGADVSNTTVVVRAGKALPFEPYSRCRLYARLEKTGRLWWTSPRYAGTQIWSRMPDAIFGTQGRKTIMVVGETDSGKSTFCTYLANTAIARGLLPCVIDCDIGQGDIAPPSSIGAAVLSNALTDLRDARASLFEFVGKISPVGVEGIIADRLRSICKRAAALGGVLIVNTDGYVDGAGVQYKRMLADSIVPDIVVFLGRTRTLQRAFASGKWKSVRARSSTLARKSRVERRWRRYDQFLRFAGEGSLERSLALVRISYLGRELDQHEIDVLASRGSVEGLFVALGNLDTIEGFGVVAGVASDSIRIQTGLANFDSIHLSNIRLAGDAAEEVSLQKPDQAAREI